MQQTNVPLHPRSQPRLLADLLPDVVATLCAQHRETLVEAFQLTGDRRFLDHYYRLVRTEIRRGAA